MQENKPVLIVGLGNPGPEYMMTRHNVGFMALDALAGTDASWKSEKNALTTRIEIDGVRAILAKPQTFMNNSGYAVCEAASFYKIPSENIIVISDDVNLDVGRLRVRGSGSAGGQKGLNDIIVQMGTDKIPRIRLGVGKKPHPDYDMANWVLGVFPELDRKSIDELMPVVYQGIEKLLAGDVDGAMQICNGAKSK